MSSVFCTVSEHESAETIIQELKKTGVDSSQISVLFAKEGKLKTLVQKENSKAPEGAAVGAGTGGLIGGILGWLVGVGSLAIPGVGPFIAAGPIMAALSGTAVGGAIGGLLGALTGLGIPEHEIKKYETRLKEGDLFVAVDTANNEQAEKVKDIFERCNANDVMQGEAISA